MDQLFIPLFKLKYPSSIILFLLELSFNISSTAALLVVNSVSFCLSIKYFIFIFKDILTRHSILG